MRLTVFGATGGTGRLLVRQALAIGRDGRPAASDVPLERTALAPTRL